jgi:hypothetical protein
LFGSKAFVASAAAAEARVRLAEGDAASARHGFEEAVHLWSGVGAPYETALARMGVAQAHRAEGNEESALLEFQAARSTFEQVGAVQQAERAARACADIRRNATGEGAGSISKAAVEAPIDFRTNIFSREGEYWCVTYGGHTARIRDVKGLRYLARLLADPGRQFHVLDMVAFEHGWPVEGSRTTESGVPLSILGDAGEVLDARAKDTYRRRLAEIDEDIEEARDTGDTEREAQADAERDFLLRELSRATGLGGRDRRLGSESERARASVTRAVRAAVARICEYNPELGEHLNQSIRTGTYCAYVPGPLEPAFPQ